MLTKLYNTIQNRNNVQIDIFWVSIQLPNNREKKKKNYEEDS